MNCRPHGIRHEGDKRYHFPAVPARCSIKMVTSSSALRSQPGCCCGSDCSLDPDCNKLHVRPCSRRTFYTGREEKFDLWTLNKSLLFQAINLLNLGSVRKSDPLRWRGSEFYPPFFIWPFPLLLISPNNINNKNNDFHSATLTVELTKESTRCCYQSIL